jgi:hypothetical protein
MSLTSELMAAGMPSGQANQLGFDTPALTVSAAGNSQATATQLTSDANLVTTVGASSGVILPNRPGEFVVTNNVNQTLSVYPPVGSTFAGSALNAARTLTQGQTLWAVTAGTTIFAAVG